VARVGFDLTLTCEKSLGVLSMLADPAHQPTLLRALRVANDTAIAHLDAVAAVARKRGGAVDTEGLVVATYFHATSRAADPHPHHHNVVEVHAAHPHEPSRVDTTLRARTGHRRERGSGPQTGGPSHDDHTARTVADLMMSPTRRRRAS
jgi:conjugative relaxase-like TrwC/TraI family protein